MNNSQEVFDFVVSSIVKQGRPSMDGTRCRYRNTEGLKCAAGMLIPDDVYHPSMEGMGILKLSSQFKDVIPNSIKYNMNLIVELQSCHDSAASYCGDAFLKLFTGTAKQIAEKNNLTYKF